uniref:NADH-ubiquinone oxidoreductase chain 2 n=1 Tax=Metcalfa pruinosa TaxID=1185500 RepID=A0A8F2Q3M7_9HEMI|nr:NADH dehydrogenase subunit 2 [Metcalfa pruinosa]QWV61018.1 NADH dehydrogenase subunit 2 [Metcalfa pruinosa]WAR47333.1 NADH dehydrogenase subunit 2 [Metcalfa pruinosa]
MKINLTKIMMMMMMMNSTIMAMSSNNFLYTWTAMEINMISFLPMLTKSNKMTDQTMKYFIIQGMASSMMIMAMMTNSMIESPVQASMMLTASMLMKLGLIPFHMWVPMLMNSSSWENCMLLSTIQKMIPIILTSQLTSMKTMTMPMMISLVAAPMSAMKQLSMKKIMAFSSIYNTPWMLVALMNSKPQFLMFMTIYSTTTSMLMMQMKKMNVMFTNQMMSMKKNMKITMMIMCLSMSGMPPMTGFFPKWMIIQSITPVSMTMSTMMILSSMIMSFVYIKMLSTNFTMHNLVKKTKKKEEKEMMTGYMNSFNTLGLPMMLTLKSMS